MIFKKNFNLLFFSLFIPAIFQIVLSQDSLPTLIAKEGDGIISVLRREGLDITTYYQKFIDLNEDQVSNGSLLKLGKTYKIPNSEYSYRNLGRIINLSEDTEKPIFDVASIILEKKDSTLKNTVYYLLLDTFKVNGFQVLDTNNRLRKDFALAMAKELIEHGSKVFLFEYNLENTPKLGNYIDAINKRFFKHRGAHQRLLVLDVDGGDFSKNVSVSIAHNITSQEGKNFAHSFENLFKEKQMTLKILNQNDFFRDKINFFIANNAMPAMTYIKVESEVKTKTNGALADVEKNYFINLITTGIKVDYSNIIIED